MEEIVEVNIENLNLMEKELKRFLMSYKFGLEEVMTKINILNEEFQYIHDYNPIEHIKSRVKSPKSIFEKVDRKNFEMNLASIKENIQDIAGIRIVCSFVADIYIISEMIQKQKDLKLIKYRDYIKEPKPNGYRSLHLIVEVPVFMTDRVENVCVEIQIRTMAMDFWASLEHKIYYKYSEEVPQRLKDELKDAASTVCELDDRMESLNREIMNIKAEQIPEDTIDEIIRKNILELSNNLWGID